MVMASLLYAVESSWLVSSTWTIVECDNAIVYVSTHSSISDYTVPPNVHLHSVFTVGRQEGAAG